MAEKQRYNSNWNYILAVIQSSYKLPVIKDIVCLFQYICIWLYFTVWKILRLKQN